MIRTRSQISRPVVVTVLVILSLVNVTPASAAPTTVTQVIDGVILCSLDQTHDGQSSDVAIQPESCQPHASTTNPQTASTENDVNSSTDPTEMINPPNSIATVDIDRPGNQSFFEDTVVEPFASWTGIGDPAGLNAYLVIAIFTVSTAVCLAVDAALFKFTYTQRLWNIAKRRLAALKSAVRAIFRV